MQKRLLTASLCLSCLVLFSFTALAGSPTGQARSKAPSFAIVLASFGSTDAEAQKVQDAFLQAARERYAPTPVYMGFTARIVMKKLQEQGKDAPSLFRILAELGDQGYDHIAVQSMQVITGAEFEGVKQIATAQEGLPKGFKRVVVGDPLVASNEQAAELAHALIASLPKERKSGEPVIFIGHGAEGRGGLSYPALNWHLQILDPMLFISTVEGAPSMDDTLIALPAPEGKKLRVWLAPLLALAGEHARNDIFGADPDSWKSMLTAKGYECMNIEKALLSLPAVRELWFAHLDEALLSLGYEKK
ncbi:sirohydrochlorin cobaltochelatase [Desulfovibrio sp. OttesenSCG-928-I05]|nr:sirohydrochlorin cobaltochelatase [Desulfovibrio sp. OttesenSCG-928-I05]